MKSRHSTRRQKLFSSLTARSASTKRSGVLVLCLLRCARCCDFVPSIYCSYKKEELCLYKISGNDGRKCTKTWSVDRDSTLRLLLLLVVSVWILSLVSNNRTHSDACYALCTSSDLYRECLCREGSDAHRSSSLGAFVVALAVLVATMIM